MSMGLRLRFYLYINNIKPKGFADSLDIHINYLRLIMNGVMIPGPKLARNIEKMTMGEIIFTPKAKKPRPTALVESEK